MKRMNMSSFVKTWFFLNLTAVMCCISFAKAGDSSWERKKVDWRLTGDERIKAIRYPEHKEPPIFSEKQEEKIKILRKDIIPKRSLTNKSNLGLLSQLEVSANIINSPPIDGFIPRIVVTATDKQSTDDDWVAQTHTSVLGRYLTDSPETTFTIGLFDTGASAHVIGYNAAKRLGIYAANLLTPSFVEVIGASNSVFARVSYPLAIFIDGLAAMDPNGTTFNDENMVGQSNVSVMVGDVPEVNQPDLPTAIGSPMSVNFVTAINNENPITVMYDGNEYTAPDIRFYEHYDSQIPHYDNRVPLNLIPSGAVNIQYLPDFEAILELIFRPGSPSIIVGNLAQSLFFVESVDLNNGAHSAIDKDRFMLDTGAQITVVGSSVGSRLGLNPANPDFEVEIEDVTGEITINPGFYIDSIEIPALGDWLSFTNVPVVLLDVASPEGGTLDGIIGTNLFVYYNLVLRGGGLLGQEPPSLEFELIPSLLTADIVPDGGDGVVDYRDLDVIANAWLSTTESPNWNPKADLAPQTPDGVVDFFDLAEFAKQWHDSIAP
jgi:hypothetical protein